VTGACEARGDGGADPALTAGIVRRFYDDMWNRWDRSLVEELLAEDLTFRGSLGVDVLGRAAFRDYMASVQAGFPDFSNRIVDLVVAADRAVARLEYSGTHLGTVLGLPATGRRVGYSGAAFFTVRRGRVVSVWVLGDLDGLRRQLAG